MYSLILITKGMYNKTVKIYIHKERKKKMIQKQNKFLITTKVQ